MENQTLPTGIKTADTHTPVLSQKQAVYQIIMEVVSTSGVSVAQLKDKADKSPERKKALMTIKAGVLNALVSGEISVKKEKSEAEMKRYASSLISNWFKRDKRLANA